MIFTIVILLWATLTFFIPLFNIFFSNPSASCAISLSLPVMLTQRALEAAHLMGGI